MLRRRHNNVHSVRRGVVTVKLLLVLPVVLTLLVFVLESGNLWLARMQLENSLESAALAAVQEWGGNGGGDTQIPRQVGNQFAQANAVNGLSVDLSLLDPELNYLAGNPNDNNTCPTGVFIFGTITDFDPQVVFNASESPSCGGAGGLMFDVSSQGDVGGSPFDMWGVAFRTDSDPAINASLRVDRIVIDVDPANTERRRFVPNDAQLSNGGSKVTSSNPSDSQVDNFGFVQAPSAPTSQVLFTYLDSSTLQIDFLGANGTTAITGELISGGGFDDGGFSPGDRFRFGARVEKDTQGNGNWQSATGDDIGILGTRVDVFFSSGGVPDPIPASGTFFDNRTAGLDRDNDCQNPSFRITDDRGFSHLVVHGRAIPDLPCPPTSSATNNGQSFLNLNGAGQLGQPFAVRAQAEFEVPSVVDQLFGCQIGPFRVQALTTAFYRCDDGIPCLIRIDQFVCN